MSQSSMIVCAECKNMNSIYFVISIVLLWTQHTVKGQGRMLMPPGRSSMWRMGYDTPMNHNDNVLNCGGTLYRYTKANGKCGTCGDPWDLGPRENEAGGIFASGIVTGVYTPGSTIDVVIDDVIASGGYFEFRLCDNKQFALPDTPECFENGLLPVKNSASRFFSMKNGENRLKLILPANLTCEHCVLQWKYRTAEHYGCDKQDGKERCCFGCGEIQNEYYACADIAILHEKSSAYKSHNNNNVLRHNIESHKLTRKRRAPMQEGIQIMASGPISTNALPYTPIQNRRSSRLTKSMLSILPGDVKWSWGASPKRNQRDRKLDRSRNGQVIGSITIPHRVIETRNLNGQVGDEIIINKPNSFTGVSRPEPPLRSMIKVDRPVVTQIFRRGNGQKIRSTQMFRSREPSNARRLFISPLSPTADALMIRSLNRKVISRYSPLSGSCKAIGPFRTTEMDDWCNTQCRGGNCVINECSCNGKRKSVDPCANCPYGQCANTKMELNNIYPGIFNNYSTFLECSNYDRIYGLGTYKVLAEGLPECGHPRFNRFKRQITIPIDEEYGCCGTRPQVIMPLTVKSEKKSYNVVQLPEDRNQFLVRGVCGHNSTVSCPMCVPEYNFQWVLVYDPSLDTNPPVNFVPVKFAHYCRCVNPGYNLGK